MIVVNMPGGAVQVIDKPDLLWLRKAFDSEWKGASMLQLAGERIYSIESVHELSEKFRNAKVVLAEFSAPDANKFRLVVSVKRVRQVIQSDPLIFSREGEVGARLPREATAGSAGDAGGGAPEVEC
jgi:hypothetical protein